THWNSLLKEMLWMSEDFTKEKARHRGFQRKLSKSVQLYFNNAEAREARREREQLAAERRAAARVAREVRHFWGKLNRVVAYKQKLEADEMRRRAMDKHLVFLVKQTERYTAMLAAHMHDPAAAADGGGGGAAALGSGAAGSASPDQRASPGLPDAEAILRRYYGDAAAGGGSDSDADDDSEDTDAASSVAEAGEEEEGEEAAGGGDAASAPSADRGQGVPQRGAEGAQPAPEERRDSNVMSDGENEAEEEEEEFRPAAADEPDDETTIEAEEQLGGAEDAREEISALEAEADMPLDQLLLAYGGGGGDGSEGEGGSDGAGSGGEDEEAQQNGGASAAAAAAAEEGEEGEGDGAAGAESGGEDADSAAEEDATSALLRLTAADEAARSVHVPRPFLLSPGVRLRAYQHVGLNWLVSLHERRLNGILADEMGLGKTLQTIALLAHLAAARGIWGPHLVVVPTSCIVNWETEFKRFAPAFKVLTYYGSAKRRRELRSGWTRPNQFHVCVTSYQLAVQDAAAFKRKRWYHLILDEAHNIKNFKSLRWQTLLTFNSQRRLLLTGTPLQNNLMELWSLMHFLMPHVFTSRREFAYWFSQPLTSMVEGSRGISGELVSRLHSVMRPFLLRRLKKEVAKQLPAKVEHVVMCRLSRRQAQLYEEFMSRSATRAALAGGGQFMGMMNVLMQLRKVCNHPDLFEPRTTASPFVAETLRYAPGTLIVR
ncbi:SNF2 family N-terminal domain-containing protein, partial [Tribonema minus]